MTEQQTARRESQVPVTKAGQAVHRVQAPETETIYVPDVDICEDSERIRLLADMPGVDQKSVDVSVENEVLTVQGSAQVDRIEGCKLIGQEYGVGRYRRDFTLSDAVDTEGITAKVRHGVLEVTLPKRKEAKTRRVMIEA